MERHNNVPIGPDYAKELLDANVKNRKKNAIAVARYTQDMKEGRWHNVGDPIRVGVSGALLDGQQRLTSVIESDTTQEFDLITDIPDEFMSVIDTGKTRTPGDVFSMNGIVDPNTSAAISRMYIKWMNGTTLNKNRPVSNQELLDFATQHADRLDEATRQGRDSKRGLGMNPTVAGTIYFAARDVADLFDVNYFFSRLFDGNFMTPGNPIGVLRNFILRQKKMDARIGREEFLYYSIQTWNNWATGDSVARLQLPKGGLQRSEQFRPLQRINPGIIPPNAHDEQWTPKVDNLVIKEGGGHINNEKEAK
jgi:hypothetical protein